jgi:hypothetical protein
VQSNPVYNWWQRARSGALVTTLETAVCPEGKSPPCLGSQYSVGIGWFCYIKNRCLVALFQLGEDV